MLSAKVSGTYAQTFPRINNLREVVGWGNRPMKDIGVQKTTFDSIAARQCKSMSAPTSAKCLVKVNQGEIFIKEGIIDPHLRLEIPSLSIQDIYII